MKRIFVTLAAVAGMAASAGIVHADPGGFAPPPASPGGSQSTPGGGEFSDSNTLMGYATARSTKAPDRFGLLPGLRKAFHLDKSCNTCGDKGGHHGWSHSGGRSGGGGGAGYANQGSPPVMQGTLVFPNHPYVRSPRDFFMYEPGR